MLSEPLRKSKWIIRKEHGCASSINIIVTCFLVLALVLASPRFTLTCPVLIIIMLASHISVFYGKLFSAQTTGSQNHLYHFPGISNVKNCVLKNTVEPRAAKGRQKIVRVSR